jgi:hypothetical protein
MATLPIKLSHDVCPPVLRNLGNDQTQFDVTQASPRRQYVFEGVNEGAPRLRVLLINKRIVRGRFDSIEIIEHLCTALKRN